MAKTPYREKPSELHAKNLSELKERIKQGKVGGSYVFYGDEEYTKNHYYSLLCSTSGEADMNVRTIYGNEFTLAQFMCACETSAVESVDMFSSDAQADGEEKKSANRVIRLINPSFSDLTKKDAEFFVETLSELSENTVVVFWFYAGDAETFGKGIYKQICDSSLVVNFKREAIGSPVLITWILRHFSKAKINIERNVAVYLGSVVGNSMTDLKNEIDKCIDYLRFENRDTLETSDVDMLCIKSTEAQIFDISNNAMKGSFSKAQTALGVLRERKEKPIVILGTISKSVNDLCMVDSCLGKGMTSFDISKKTGLMEFMVRNQMAVLTARNSDFHGNERFAKTASRLCLEYDDKLKSSRTDGYELLTELVFKLSCAGRLHAE